MNKFLMHGRLTADPEIRATQSGMQVARFTVAADRIRKGEADFITWTAWDKTADLLDKYFHKGSEILVEGRVENDNYEKDGKKVYGFRFSAERVEFCGSKADNASSPAQAVPKVESNGFMTAQDDVGELPFN